MRIENNNPNAGLEKQPGQQIESDDNLNPNVRKVLEALVPPSKDEDDNLGIQLSALKEEIPNLIELKKEPAVMKAVKETLTAVLTGERRGVMAIGIEETFDLSPDIRKEIVENPENQKGAITVLCVAVSDPEFSVGGADCMIQDTCRRFNFSEEEICRNPRIIDAVKESIIKRIEPDSGGALYQIDGYVERFGLNEFMQKPEIQELTGKAFLRVIHEGDETREYLEKKLNVKNNIMIDDWTLVKLKKFVSIEFLASKEVQDIMEDKVFQLLSWDKYVEQSKYGYKTDSRIDNDANIAIYLRKKGVLTEISDRIRDAAKKRVDEFNRRGEKGGTINYSEWTELANKVGETFLEKKEE